MQKWLFIALGFSFFLIAGKAWSQSSPTAVTPKWKLAPVPPPMPVADDSGFVRSGDTRIYFAEFNRKGPNPVLLLHGGFTSSDYWSAEVTQLSRTHRIIVIDNRAQGRSTAGSSPFSYDLLSGDILQVLDQLSVKTASIVGWSDGGIIGLILAIHHPERINRLFVYGTNYNLAGYRKEDPDSTIGPGFMKNAEMNYRRHSATPDSFRVMRRTLGKMYSREPDLVAADLKKIKAPVMIAFGRYEQFISQEHFQEMANLIPNASLLMLPDMSHGGPLQDPAAFDRAVTYFLDPSGAKR